MSKDKPWLANPVASVKFVPLEQVEANDYNPNAVAPREMQLLHKSISEDGYTQPVVVIHDKERDKYVIVDGFHRFTVMSRFKDIREKNAGMLPVVVIDKPINDRMASTVRHNRARGKHSVSGMADMVFAMLEELRQQGEEPGVADAKVCNDLGLSPEELLRYKHVTGFSKLFKDGKFGPAWKTKRMAELERDFKKGEKAGEHQDAE